jgi:hypothetical protein
MALNLTISSDKSNCLKSAIMNNEK